MGIIKTAAIIGGGYLLVRYALPQQKAIQQPAPVNTNNGNQNAIHPHTGDQSYANTMFPSFLKSFAELLTEISDNPQKNYNKIYY